MEVLRVRDVTKSFDGRTEMEIRTKDFEDVLWFKLPSGFRPSSEQIACAVAAIFGSKFDTVEFLEPISSETRHALSRATSTNWQAPEKNETTVIGGTNSTLSFSGGFDSLAALAILGEKSNLVSIDFGKRFSREKNFFEQFSTTSVETNAREFESSWTFMGIGAILLREYFRADYFAFGSILEASPWHFSFQNRSANTHAIFAAAGLKAINPILGLTEFETTRIAAQAFPEVILESLTSLAEVHSEKYLRKTLMLKYINSEIELGLDFDEIQTPDIQNPIPWGSSFAADFLAPGIFRYCGESANEWMEIPERSREYFEQMDLGFYWRENTALSTKLPLELRSVIAANKARLEVLPFGPTDWSNFRQLSNLLSFRHRIPSLIPK